MALSKLFYYFLLSVEQKTHITNDSVHIAKLAAIYMFLRSGPAASES